MSLKRCVFKGLLKVAVKVVSRCSYMAISVTRQLPFYYQWLLQPPQYGTGGWALDKSANSSQSLDHPQYVFASCDLWPFDLILTDGRGLVTDYPCAKFGDCSFSSFGFIVWTNTHTHTETDSAKRLLAKLLRAWVTTGTRRVCVH